MAQLWIRGEADRWISTPLSADGFDLSVGPSGDDEAAVTVAPAPASASGWALVAPPTAATLNGLPLWLGIAVLEDRDEVTGETRAYFSTEVTAEVAPYALDRGTCPRCKRPLVRGASAVRCPGCGVWHHQDDSDGFTCWTYGPTCACCAQPTALDAGFRWSPEDL
jgi:hypothetical protein